MMVRLHLLRALFLALFCFHLAQTQPPQQQQQQQLPTCGQSTAAPAPAGIDAPCGNSLLPDGPELKALPSFSSTDGVLSITMEVLAHRLELDNVFSFNRRAFCVNGECGAVAPTLRVHPGETLEIHLENKLEDDGTTEVNHTNVHTHGLHVDPAVDNEFVKVAPGQDHTYTISIPSNHQSGLHWYHAHVHPISAIHVLQGLVGALVVEPSDAELATLPFSYTGMPKHELVLSHISLCSCNPSQNSFRIFDLPELQATAGDTLPLDATGWEQSGLTDVYLTNGQYQPHVNMQTGQWTRVDIVNAVGDTFLELEASSCEVMVMAIDGVFLVNGPRSVSFFSLVPAGRVSLAVRCSSAGTFQLVSNPQLRASEYHSAFSQNLLTLEVSGAEMTSVTPTWSDGDILFPYYLRDLREETVGATFDVGIQTGGGVFALGVGLDCSTQNPGCNYAPFGGATELDRHVGRLCDVEELTFIAPASSQYTGHPMHLHVNHFQVISTQSERYYSFGQLGDFRDTVPAFEGATTIRYALDTYGGAHILHCHTLMHEDNGMMTSFWVDNTSPRCTFEFTNRAQYCTNVPAEADSIQYATILADPECDLNARDNDNEEDNNNDNNEGDNNNEEDSNEDNMGDLNGDTGTVLVFVYGELILEVDVQEFDSLVLLEAIAELLDIPVSHVRIRTFYATGGTLSRQIEGTTTVEFGVASEEMDDAEELVDNLLTTVSSDDNYSIGGYRVVDSEEEEEESEDEDEDVGDFINDDESSGVVLCAHLCFTFVACFFLLF